MQKRSKKRAAGAKTSHKMSRIVSKIRNIERSERENNGLSTDIDGPLSYWYVVLSKLSKSNLKFISGYRARDGHLFNVVVFKEAFSTLMLERAIGLEGDKK